MAKAMPLLISPHAQGGKRRALSQRFVPETSPLFLDL